MSTVRGEGLLVARRGAVMWRKEVAHALGNARERGIEEALRKLSE